MDCATHIGVDEAGLGPNLGPLVIVATRWDGFAHPTDQILYRLADRVTDDRAEAEQSGKLLIGDSKLVYRDRRDTEALHAVAGALLEAAGVQTETLRTVVGAVDPDALADFDAAPWYSAADRVSSVETPREPASRSFADLLASIDGRLHVAASVVPAGRFNRLLASSQSKGDLLSRLSLQTLRRVWEPDGSPAVIWCDKHGGRNVYAQHLTDICDGGFVQVISEDREESRYAIAESTVTFGVKSERHFPVACASLIAKSIRQRCMAEFNAFWQRHDAALRPTEGYPTDARRFADDVSDLRARLAIADDLFWRQR